MKVLIPTPLRGYAGGKAIVDVAANTAGEVLRELTTRHPDLRRQLFAEDGTLRKFVNVYINDSDIRYLENENTPVKDDDTLSIIPSVAGGKGNFSPRTHAEKNGTIATLHSASQCR